MKYVIFGAGVNSIKIIKKVKDNLDEIVAIIDNSESKINTFVDGIEVKSVDYINTMEHGTKILISVASRTTYGEICKQLSGYNLKENEDFFDAFKYLQISVDTPGLVSGFVKLPEDLSGIKTFDNTSRLIHVKNEEKIYRVVSRGYEQEYLDVLEKCKKAHLLGNEVVNTKMATDLSLDEYDLILEHEYINPISYCFEWAPGMIFSYTIYILNLIKKLTENGLGLVDGHVLNATINKGDFLFIDFGAIKSSNTSGKVLMEILNTHILPLVLFSHNQIDKAYMHLKNPGIEFSILDVKGYLDNEEWEKLLMLHDVAKQVSSAENIYNFVSIALEYVSAIHKEFSKTIWIGYQDDEWNWSHKQELWSEKMKNAISLIRKVQVDTVIDLAGNMGWYGSYLCHELKYSIVLDIDYACIDDLWNRCKNLDIKNVFPLYMSVCSPTLDYYRDDPISNSGIVSWRKNAFDRMKADLAMALAIIHHLVFRQQLTFEEIIDQFSKFTRKYLIIEYVDIEDQYIIDFQRTGFEWYTEENFVSELSKKFDILETLPSTPSETRTLYLCKKR